MDEETKALVKTAPTMADILSVNPAQKLCEEQFWSLKDLFEMVRDEFTADEVKYIRVVKPKKNSDENKPTYGPNVTVVYSSKFEEILAVRSPNWAARQKARMDVHALRGDYPAEKKELKHTGDIGIKQSEIPEERRKILSQALDALYGPTCGE